MAYIPPMIEQAAAATIAPGDSRKGTVVHFRCTDSQKEALIEYAASRGLSVGTWLRNLALRKAGAVHLCDDR